MQDKHTSLTPPAKKLRKDQTDTERHLWNSLRAKKLGGLKFRRQAPLGPYIVDFVCLEKKVIIECDGSQHIENENQDIKRDAWLKSQGFKVLRFWNNIIFQETESVLEEIFNKCHEESPSP
ncbi:MAG: endonuclease domain-containing protein [Deltaproteobacteria bacterium]|nr:endonuclease domain-containing protein [Deltaproteobacteria bacterium]